MIGLDFGEYRWYRKWQGGKWSLIRVNRVNIELWIRDYKGLDDCEVISVENW